MTSKKGSISNSLASFTCIAKLKSFLHHEPFERNKIIFVLFHLLKTYIRNAKIKTKLFLYSSTSSNTRAYIRAQRLFSRTWDK
jgi:hypothetical protein